MSLEETFSKITATACKNVTFSGGEPFDQADELINLAILLTVHDYHIMAYTGYTFEEIVNDHDKLALLQYIDILVDGPFIEEQKDITLKFKGSANQRVIDLRKTIANNEIIIYDI